MESGLQMKKIIGFLFIIAGLYFCFHFFYHFFAQQQETSIALEEAQEIVKASREVSQERSAFQPAQDEVAGILTIPKLGKSLPIVEGTEEEMLAKGVGHHDSTVFPGDGEQILLSGHRDTVFRSFGELEVGDRFIVEMPYGTYEYEMRESEIVDAEDRTVISSKGEEVLTLSTCYPFSFIGYAPDRYIIYAYPVGESAE